MNYKKVFAFESKEQKNTEYTLKDYNYILESYSDNNLKFDDDFYLRVFLKKLLFDVDIIEIETFLEFQFDSSVSPSKFIKILDLKVVPAIRNIVEDAQFNPLGRGYFEEEDLLDGFIKTEGIIKNWDFDYVQFLHLVAVKGLKNDLKKRVALVVKFLESIQGLNPTGNKLTWIGNDSQLVIVVNELVKQKFIEAPKHKNGEINYTELCKQIKHSFSHQEGLKINSMRRYASPDDDKNQKLNDKFQNEGFYIPDREILS